MNIALSKADLTAILVHLDDLKEGLRESENYWSEGYVHFRKILSHLDTSRETKKPGYWHKRIARYTRLITKIERSLKAVKS